jgi:quinol monooxygenase YgiN
MFVRMYRTKADPAKLSKYEEFEATKGIPMVRGMKGCVAVAFGRIIEEKEPSYVFFSVWNSKDECEAARKTPAWKKVAGELEAMKFTVGTDRAEHLDLRGYVADAKK